MSKRFVTIAVGALLASIQALPAAAQVSGGVIQQGEVEQVAPIAPDEGVDQVVGPTRSSGFRAPEGVRVVAPGALLFASFDRNFDGKVTMEEIEAGAAGAFAVADRNGDGVITGFEQNDWANSVGSMNDVLSNPMTFDVDLDRSITQAEFTAGLKRIAQQVSPGVIHFADLMKPLNQREEQASRDGVETITRPIARGPGARAGQ